jgi:hypothetical protein
MPRELKVSVADATQGDSPLAPKIVDPTAASGSAAAGTPLYSDDVPALPADELDPAGAAAFDEALADFEAQFEGTQQAAAIADVFKGTQAAATIADVFKGTQQAEAFARVEAQLKAAHQVAGLLGATLQANLQPYRSAFSAFEEQLQPTLHAVGLGASMLEERLRPTFNAIGMAKSAFEERLHPAMQIGRSFLEAKLSPTMGMLDIGRSALEQQLRPFAELGGAFQQQIAPAFHRYRSVAAELEARLGPAIFAARDSAQTLNERLGPALARVAAFYEDYLVDDAFRIPLGSLQLDALQPLPDPVLLLRRERAPAIRCGKCSAELPLTRESSVWLAHPCRSCAELTSHLAKVPLEPADLLAALQEYAATPPTPPRPRPRFQVFDGGASGDAVRRGRLHLVRKE